MANRRNLKKDIDYLTNEVISDCYIYVHLNPKKNLDKVTKIIEETIEMRKDLIYRINHIESKNDVKVVKAHFKKICDDLIAKVDNSFTKLSELNK